MSKADEYRERAAACEQNAACAESENNRQAWLSIARDWLAMVPEQASESPPADAEVQPPGPEAPAAIAQAIEGSS